MKKFLVIALVVVMALGVFAFAACEKGETVDGEYSYANPYVTTGDSKYGCKVKVTVKGGVITAIEVAADTDTFYNLSEGWKNEDGTPTTGKKAWMDNGKAMADSFVSMKVADVNAIKVTCEKSVPSKIESAPTALKVVSGATQSSGRLILAVQNALSKLAK